MQPVLFTAYENKRKLHFIRMGINTPRQRNGKKPFEMGRITLRLDSTNINRAYYEDPRKKPLLVVFNIHERKRLPQLAGQTVKPFPRRKSAPILIRFVAPAPRKRAPYDNCFSAPGTTKILLLPARRAADGINLVEKIERIIALSRGNSAIFRPSASLKRQSTTS